MARIFLDADGWHVCDNALEFLDARNRAFGSRKAAVDSLRRNAGEAGAYTHYINGRGQIVEL